MRFEGERELVYREHVYSRERSRLNALVLITAPMLLVFVLMQAAVGGLSPARWLSAPLFYLLFAALLATTAWMRRQRTALPFAWGGVFLLGLFSLSCALLLLPSREALSLTLPMFIAAPLLAAPFWTYRPAATAALLASYLASSVALWRVGAEQALWLAFLIQAAVSTLAATLVFNAMEQGRRAHFEAEEELLQHSRLDSLTRLLNRRHFMAMGEALIAGMDRDAPLCACFLDLDHFKRVNDEGSHRIGDQMLVETARRLLGNGDDSRVVGRLGGEEFALLLPGQSPAEALALTERLRALIAAIEVEGFAITASAGLAERRPGERLSELLHRADLALLAAKRDGRDRVVAWSPALQQNEP